MCDDEWQRAFMLRANMNEMDVQSIDLGDELRQRVQPRLYPAPVIAGRPIARELLHGRKRHALRIVGNRLILGPPRRGDARALISQDGFRNVDAEGADGFTLRAEEYSSRESLPVTATGIVLIGRSRLNLCRTRRP